MLAFRAFDTNSATQQEQLGLSPPTKKCATSPSKVPIDGDCVFHGAQGDEDSSSFRFDLQAVDGRGGLKADASGSKAKNKWQEDLLSQLSAFDSAYQERKAALMKQLGSADAAQSKPLVDNFLRDMERESLAILKG